MSGGMQESFPELLATLVKEWGEWYEFKRCRAPSGETFFVCSFVGEFLVRICTVGLSSMLVDGQAFRTELLIVLERGEFDAFPEDSVMVFLADISAHLLNHKISPNEGTLMRTTIAPWDESVLLFNPPLGEPESMECFDADGLHLTLYWVIPIYESEAKLIESRGLEKFDLLVERAEVSLVRPSRPAVGI